MKYGFYILTIMLLVVTKAYSQNVVNEGSVIRVEQNTILSAIDITNNGRINNDGRILISDSWQNNADYVGAGSLVLSSDQTQVVNNNAKTFNRLEVLGSGDKIFQADLTIEDELILSEGILKSENNSTLYLEDGAIVSGGSDNSYVEGKVVNKGTGEKIFPLGTSGIYYPLMFVNVQDENLELSVEVINPNPVNKLSGVLSSVSSNVAWQVEAVSGTWSGSIVEIAVRNETFTGLVQDLVVVQAGDENDNYRSIGQSGFSGDFSQGTITSLENADQQLISVGSLSESSGSNISVYNAVSPNGDGLHEYLQILNIEAYPGNSIEIFNRWGDKVFEVRDYDNNVSNKRFEGVGTGNYGELPDGTYYYTIDPISADKISGFFVLKR